MANYGRYEMMGDFWLLPDSVQRFLSSHLTSQALTKSGITVIRALASINEMLAKHDYDFDVIRLKPISVLKLNDKVLFKAFSVEKSIILVELLKFSKEHDGYEICSTLTLAFKRQIWKLLSKLLPLFAKEFEMSVLIGNSHWDCDSEYFYPAMSFQEWAFWVEREEVNHG